MSPTELADAQASRSEILAEVRHRAEAGLSPSEAWLEAAAREPDAADPPGLPDGVAPAAPPTTGQSSDIAARKPVTPERRLRRPGKAVLIAAAAVIGVLACVIPLLLGGGGQQARGHGAAPGPVLSGSPASEPAGAAAAGTMGSPGILGSPTVARPGTTGSQAGSGSQTGGAPTAKAGGGPTGTTPTALADMPSAGKPPGRTVPPSAPAPPAAPGTGTATAVPIRNHASGRCIDIRGDDGRPDGTQLQLWDCSGTDWQLWTFMPDGTVRSLGKCMDVVAGATSEGAQVDWTTCDGASSQRFTLNAAHDLVNAPADKCVDTAGGGTANGTVLQLVGCDGQSSQKWSSG